jgi:uncharacterized protein (TIGR00255 family)
MSVYSMTGYAIASVNSSVATTEVPPSEELLPRTAFANSGSEVSVELRSVNSRFLDLHFRVPEEYRGLESALRELLTSKFKRGKIEVRLSRRSETEDVLRPPLPAQLSRLAHIQSMVQGWLPQAQAFSVNEVMQWSKTTAPVEKLNDSILAAAQQAVTDLLEARQREGSKLVKVLMERVAKLFDLAKQIEPQVPEIVQRQQEKFLERWQETLALAGAGAVSPEAAQERAMNEATAFALRVDVAEEVARLQSHLEEITRLLKKGGEVGKRLDFLIQELLREANTVASKASTLELTNLSIEMKVAIEQMREQVQNLE